MSIPMAVVRSVAVNAARGQYGAQRLFAEMLSAIERQDKELADAWIKSAMDYKIGWDAELERRKRDGITDLPEPLPHPDLVKIDMNAGEGAVKLMRASIRLLAQPNFMRSIIGATRQEQRRGLA